MKHDNGELDLIDMIGMDRGAMPKEFIRRLQINCYDCNSEHQTISLMPNETAILEKCKNKPISWEGTLKWDGRHITGDPKGEGFWSIFKR
jgi:hypothetical protein